MNTEQNTNTVENGGSALNVQLYRILSKGEIIQDGDEGFNHTEEDGWLKITPDELWGWVIGMPVCEMVPDIRRAL
jgi:hypothetical protein